MSRYNFVNVRPSPVPYKIFLDAHTFLMYSCASQLFKTAYIHRCSLLGHPVKRLWSVHLIDFILYLFRALVHPGYRWSAYTCNDGIRKLLLYSTAYISFSVFDLMFFESLMQIVILGSTISVSTKSYPKLYLVELEFQVGTTEEMIQGLFTTDMTAAFYFTSRFTDILHWWENSEVHSTEYMQKHGKIVQMYMYVFTLWLLSKLEWQKRCHLTVDIQQMPPNSQVTIACMPLPKFKLQVLSKVFHHYSEERMQRCLSQWYFFFLNPLAYCWLINIFTSVTAGDLIF